MWLMGRVGMASVHAQQISRMRIRLESWCDVIIPEQYGNKYLQFHGRHLEFLTSVGLPRAWSHTQSSNHFSQKVEDTSYNCIVLFITMFIIILAAA